MVARNPEYNIASWGEGSSASPEIRANEIVLEREVSGFIREMPFLWLEIDDNPGRNSLRGYIESNSIALLSNYRQAVIDPPSEAWLGLHSLRAKVRESGLWNQIHVEDMYDPGFLTLFDNLVSKQVNTRGLV